MVEGPSKKPSNSINKSGTRLTGSPYQGSACGRWEACCDNYSNLYVWPKESETMADEEIPEAGGLWTLSEINASVDAWIRMLQNEQSGVSYVKADIVRQLQDGVLKVRNKASIEKRFSNISAVAIALDNDYVEGYKPLSNVGPTQWGRIEQRFNHHSIGNVIEQRIEEEVRRIQDSLDSETMDEFEKLRIREKAWQLVTKRRGQNKFRKMLLSTYDERCVISRSDSAVGLEAAHIEAYNGPSSNVPANGLLLRADIHEMFDRGLLGIEPDGLTTVLSPSLRNTTYSQHEGQRIILPGQDLLRPDPRLLKEHLELAKSYW